ncbi:MAG: DUF6686 family protein [Bacteroidota bacterium]
MAQFEEIFSTAHGSMYQCSHTYRYRLHFKGLVYTFKVNDFQQLKRTLDRVDVMAMLHNPDSSCDLEIITPPQSDRCYVLTLCDIIHLKELLAGTKVMLSLNSILKERLYTAFA